jgi:hypothetical protein
MRQPSKRIPDSAEANTPPPFQKILAVRSQSPPSGLVRALLLFSILTNLTGYDAVPGNSSHRSPSPLIAGLVTDHGSAFIFT